MIDKKWIGYKLPDSTLELDRSRLRFFAKVIGETDPVYTDSAAAREAGHPDMLVPPTFLFAAELDSGAMLMMLKDLGIPMMRILHGEQSFSYHMPVYAGDKVTVEATVTDIYNKKGGALEFVVKDSRVTNQHGELVAELRAVLVVRN